MTTTTPMKTTFETKDTRISRHGAMNTAIQIVTVSHAIAPYKNDMTDHALQDTLTRWADWVLAYVNEAQP